ncbi:non-ribosomal peptide synthetase [Actinophytocola gossypii]|uniref:Amino acid adenylation domain-containing protein n=1 Tax=Actinophytocola gossypii TaxID=2812003 RepID=A0ABT2J288_9PSEU|nr:non-ribosomal peptide synthetase [Actinophytocola gossypii]MCT2581928.1 amino acid adenylation domain-containing protein [Actinophytocola gossypii]
MTAQPTEAPLEPAAPEELPASFAQERLWFATELVPDVAVYNIVFPVAMPGSHDPDRFDLVLRRLVDRHETLRSALAARDGAVCQLVHDRVTFELAETDHAHLPEAEVREHLDRLLAEDGARPFDLGRAPLWRGRVVHWPGGRWVFGFVVHHAMFDAQSVSNLVAELTELYRAASEDRAPRLPELPIQYADFAAWQRGRLDSGELDGDLDYWRDRLAGLPPEIGLPTDRPRPPRASHRGADLWFTVPAEDHHAVTRFARSAATTDYAVLLAAFVTVLHRLSGQTDVVVGCPVAGREPDEVAPLLGMFVNQLVLRTDCAGEPTFRELVSRTTDTVRSALRHAELPFDRLVEVLAPNRDASRAPLYQVVLNLIPTIAAGQTGNGTAKVDLILDLAGAPDGVLNGRLEYATDLFDEATARALTERFTGLLRAAVAAPDTPLHRLPLLLPGEDSRLRAAAAPTTVHEPAGDTVLDRITPADTLAVADSTGVRLTYRELLGRANALAHRLAAAGAGSERPVGLLLDNTADLAVGVLGVLTSGAPYLPLDPEHPTERLHALLADTGAVTVVAAAPHADRVSGLPVLVPDGTEAATGPGVPVLPDTLAYLIHTSGSTGRPKAVGVTHRNLTAYLDGLADLLGHPERPVWTLTQPLTYDFGLTAFFGALAAAGTLHVVAREHATDAAWLADHLARDGIEYLKLTPSHLTALLDALPDPAALRPARALLLGGEGSRVDLVRDLRARGAVVNHYGPTETTVGVLALPAEREPRPLGQVTPIGWPLTHASAHVLDAHGQPVPDGVIGELCVGGDTVARGYLGRPGLTADRFVPDPFGRPGARLYRTGDRVRRLADGSIEFLGRADDQVKIRGFRVEPGEVRAVLAAHPDVADCAVVASAVTATTTVATAATAAATAAVTATATAVTGAAAATVTGAAIGAGSVELTAYLVPAAGRRLDPATVREHAAATLPEHMLPAGIVVLDALPLTPHGKLDRARLPEPAPPQPEPDHDAPVGELEEVVAGLFRTLLRRDTVGRTDDFMAIGGHSLLAIQLMTRIRKTFGVALPLPVVFEQPTVAALAAAVAGRLRTGDLPPIEPAPDPAPASYGEQRLWFLDQLNPGVPLHNVQFLRRLTGPLDPDVLERALHTIIRRHEVLRTRFAVTPDGLVRAVDDDPDLPLEFVDLTGRDDAERERLFDERAARPFQLTTELPLRMLLVRLAPESHQLLLTVHHAVFDGPSVEVLSAELAELYPALRDGRTPSLPELPVRYADFAAWQRSSVTQLADTQLPYWRDRLTGLPDRLALPTDRPRPPRLDATGAHLRFAVPPEVADGLRALGGAEGATLFMVTVACYAELLRRRTGQADLAIGVPMITRPRPELEPLIGFFVNTLVLRVDTDGGPTVRELVRRVRQRTIEAYTNADVPFEALVEELGVARDPSVTPLVQTMFMLADDRRALPVDLGGVRMDFEPLGQPAAKFDLFLYLWRRPDGLTGVAEYRPELFDESTVRGMTDEYTALLAAAVADPDAPLAQLGKGPADDD